MSATPTKKALQRIEMYRDMVRRYEAGESSFAIAKVFGKTPMGVRHALKKNGVNTRPVGRVPRQALAPDGWATLENVR